MNDSHGHYQHPSAPQDSHGRGDDGMGQLTDPAVRQSVQNATASIQTIIDTAERAAASIRLEAEEQARRYLEDAKRRADTVTAERVRMISELTDDLLAQAGVVKVHSERMASALEDAIRTISSRLDIAEREARGVGTAPWPDPAPAGPPEPTADYPPPTAPPEQARRWPPPGPAADGPAPVDPTNPPEEALIRATQLAVAGSGREEVRQTLQHEFGLNDPTPILDRIMSTETE